MWQCVCEVYLPTYQHMSEYITVLMQKYQKQLGYNKTARKDDRRGDKLKYCSAAIEDPVKVVTVPVCAKDFPISNL